MRYYKSLNVLLLQRYWPSKLVVKKYSRPFGFEAMFFASLHSESLLSERPGFESRPGQTLRANNFAALGPAGSKTNFFEGSNLFLLVKEEKWGVEVF